MSTISTIFQTYDDVWADTFIIKVVTCVPLIGIVIGFHGQKAAKEQLSSDAKNSTLTPDKCYRIIKVKNDYKILGGIRSLLELVMIVVFVAIAFFSLAEGVICGIVPLAVIVWNSYSLYRNLQIMKGITTATTTVPASINLQALKLGLTVQA